MALHWERVALSAEQVEEYALPENPGKEKSPNAAKFIAKYGENIQVELDAVPPDVLREIYAEAIEPYWDEDAHAAALEREDVEREQLRAGAAKFTDGDEEGNEHGSSEM